MCSLGGTYVAEFLQFWVFTLGAPALAVLVVLNNFKKHLVLSFIVSLSYIASYI